MKKVSRSTLTLVRLFILSIFILSIAANVSADDPDAPADSGDWSATASSTYKYCVRLISGSNLYSIVKERCFQTETAANNYKQGALDIGWKVAGQIWVNTNQNASAGWEVFMAPNHCVAASDGSNDIKVPVLPTYFLNNVGSLTANGWGCTHAYGLEGTWYTGNSVTCAAYCSDTSSFGIESLRFRKPL